MDRQSAQTSKIEKKTKLQLEEEKKKKKSRRRYTIAISLLSLFIVFVIAVNSALFYSVLPAAKAGDENFSTAEFNYVYMTNFVQFYNQYGSYISYLFDPTLSLADQECGFTDDGSSWADYFRNSALESLRTISVRYEAAREAGRTLTESEQQQIDDTIANYQAYADNYNESLEQFLATNFGRGVTEKTVRHMTEMMTLGSSYAQSIYDGGIYTDEELENYYQEHADEYNKIHYLSVFVDGSVPETDSDNDGTADEVTDEQKTAAMQTAKETATRIAAAADADEFRSFAEDETGSAAKENSTVISSLPEGGADWLKDSARTEGETNYYEDGTGYTAVCFLSLDDNHYNTVSVRHILISAADTDGDGTVSDEEKAAAEDRINEIYDEWKSGDATEDSFAELANTYSEDSGSNTNGGLYEGVYKDEMVEEFNDFCFAEHQPGDTEIVYNEDTGYHLIYFVGQGDLYSNMVADSAMRSADMSAWQDGLLTDYQAKTTFVIRFAEKETDAVIKNIVSSASSSS
jgi:parvulin-like peptidyl-prolyl isomerase